MSSASGFLTKDLTCLPVLSDKSLEKAEAKQMPVDDVLTCRPRCHYTLGVLLSLKSLSFHQPPLSVSTIQVTNPRKDPLS